MRKPTRVEATLDRGERPTIAAGEGRPSARSARRPLDELAVGFRGASARRVQPREGRVSATRRSSTRDFCRRALVVVERSRRVRRHRGTRRSWLRPGDAPGPFDEDRTAIAQRGRIALSRRGHGWTSVALSPRAPGFVVPRRRGTGTMVDKTRGTPFSGLIRVLSKVLRRRHSAVSTAASARNFGQVARIFRPSAPPQGRPPETRPAVATCWTATRTRCRSPSSEGRKWRAGPHWEGIRPLWEASAIAVDRAGMGQPDLFSTLRDHRQRDTFLRRRRRKLGLPDDVGMQLRIPMDERCPVALRLLELLLERIITKSG